MKWNVKIDFCADGCKIGAGRTEYHYYPQAKVTTDRELTADERTRINNAVVKYVAKTMIDIARESEVSNGN